MIRSALSEPGGVMLENLLATEQIGSATPQPDSRIQRVALFSEAFLPKIDGVSRSALLTARYLRATGRAVILFAPLPTVSTVDDMRVVGVPSLPMPFTPDTRVAPPWLPALPALKRFKPDLIHLFSPFGLGSLGMLAGAWLKVPVIANYQTDLPAYARSYGHGYLRGFLIGALRFLHNGSTLTLAPSDASLTELRGWGMRRLRRWERGIDLERFAPSKREPTWRARLLNGRNPKRFLALYVGRLARDKHIEVLHDLAREPEVALTLIGSGSHQGALQLYFADTDACFVGPMVGDDLANAYAAADVFVFPGPEETFGQVVLEAMASGLPTIVPDRGGPMTLVRDGQNGFIVPVDDGSAIVERVHWLLEHQTAYQALREQARADAQTRPWLQIMEQLERYYAEADALYSRHLRFRSRRYRF